MPIYEYECLQCKKRTELLQRMNDAPLATCPECGGDVRKLISAPAVQFKGSGWYVTDYGGKKGSSSGKSDGKSEGKSESSSSDSGSSSSEKSSSAEKSSSTEKSSSSDKASSSGSSGSSD
jgi:putative FmdB family regulatory protein